LKYRAARDRLVDQEVELRRAVEAVAAARRELSPGGRTPRYDDHAGYGVSGCAPKNFEVRVDFVRPRSTCR
jgi:hypothetical protein